MPYMNPGDFYTFSTGDAAAAGIFGVIMIIYMLVCAGMGVLSMVSYALHGLGLYTIAERRGIRHGWLGWIPVGAGWLLGSISDQYQYVAKGKITNRRKWILGLNIAIFAFTMVWLIAVVVGAIYQETAMGIAAPALIAGGIGGFLILMGLTVAYSVLVYIAYYDLLASCYRDNAALYLVLGIVFSVAMPFIVFAARKKDKGMPPRKAESVQQIVESAAPAEESEEAAEETTEEETPTEEGFANPEEFEEE